MNLVNFIIRKTGIPFNISFRHALAARNKSSSVIFEIISDSGLHGYGEGTPRTYVTGESIQSTIDALCLVAEKIKNLSIHPTDNVIEKIQSLHVDLNRELNRSPSAKCAMELALLDIYGKMRSEPVVNLFGEPSTSEVHYSGVISNSNSSQIIKIANNIKKLKLKQVKLKAGSDFKSDLEKYDIIKGFLGDDVAFRVDANGAWNLETAVDRIERYYKKGIDVFEQPLSADRKEDYPLLMDKLDERVKIIVDESVCTYDDALWFTDNRSANGFNLKISKHGGLIETLLIHQLASEKGFQNQLGCHVGETSILTAAGIVFAALTEKLFGYEGAYGTMLLAHDIIRNPLQFGSYGKFNFEHTRIRSGLGIEIDPDLLASASIDVNYL